MATYTPNYGSGSTPGGAAGGDLSGSYPNPSVATVGGASAASIAAEPATRAAADALKYSQTGESRQLDLPGGGAGSQAITVTETQALIDAAPADVATWATTDDSTVVGLTDATVGDLACYANGTTKRLTALPPTTLGNWTTVANQTTSTVAEGSNLYFLASRVLSTVLTGLSLASSAVISASDTVLDALGKLQAQISLKANNDATGITAATWRTALGLTTGASSNDLVCRQISGTDSLVIADTAGAGVEFVSNSWTETIDCAALAVGLAAGSRRVIPWFKSGTGTTTFAAAGGTTITNVPSTIGLTATQGTMGNIVVMSSTSAFLTGTI